VSTLVGGNNEGGAFDNTSNVTDTSTGGTGAISAVQNANVSSITAQKGIDETVDNSAAVNAIAGLTSSGLSTIDATAQGTAALNAGLAGTQQATNRAANTPQSNKDSLYIGIAVLAVLAVAAIFYFKD
jgi:hypothetical protein